MSAGFSWNQRIAAVIDRRYSAVCLLGAFFRSPLVDIRRDPLDRAIFELINIGFLARVFHRLPARSEHESPRVLDRSFVVPGILGDHFVVHVPEIGARESLDEMQFGAMGMAVVQHRVAIGGNRIEDQSVSLPAADSIAKPRREILCIFRMGTSIDRNGSEPRVLLEKERHEIVALYALQGGKSLDGAGPAIRQAG